jgi:hypothetical protein
VGKTLAAVLDDIGRGAFILAAGEGVGALSALIAPLAVIDIYLIGELIELLYDIPDDIANQMCNSFAFDCSTGFPDAGCVDGLGNPINDVDSDNWSSAPSIGTTVSPDDVHMFWDAPGPSDGAVIKGLYGYNVPAQLCVGVFNRPKCALVPSTGTAKIWGFVRYKNEVLVGAHVSAACQSTITPGVKEPYVLNVRSGGQYKVIARYDDPQTGLTLYGEVVTGGPRDPPLQPSAVMQRDITVIDPPACNRNIVVSGTITCDDVYLTGRDSSDGPFRKTLYVQSGVAIFDQDTGSWRVDTRQGQHNDIAVVSHTEGDSSASLKIEVQIDATLAVAVKLTAQLNPGDDNLSWGPVVFNVAKDQTITLSEGDLDTGGPFNDRAYYRGITIANNATPAI